ncbi:hypothetical protein AYO44_15235 [Planctomycetaceae bacterium SCGC AG-212-F19]|nr:hypothetical protein AYO44_15235 [Planctomycetaceae bacterium SCGC AG-212-F19]
MAKSLDVKQFLIHKGERLGLFVALIIMICLVGFGGASGLSVDSPATTVEVIKSKSSSIEDRIHTGPAGGDAIEKLGDLYTKTDVIGAKIAPEDYLVTNPFFRDTPLENSKRTNPVVLAPVEFNPVLVLGGVKSMMISAQRDRVQMGMLVPVDKGKNGPKLTPQQQAWLDAMRMRAEMLAARGGARPPGAIGPAVPGGVPGVGGAGDGAVTEYRLEWHDVTKLPPNAEPAETVSPVRMAVVSASFPFRTQMEIYKQSMRKGSLTDLLKDDGELLPRFLRFQVRRRTLEISGKVKEDWRDLNLETDFAPLIATAVGTEKESDQLRRVIFPGLVMFRPTLAVGTYPDNTPGLVAKSLRVLEQKLGKGAETKVLSPLERKIAGEGVDIFGDLPRMEEDKGKRAPRRPGDDDKGARDREPEFVVPDYCLLRFIDVTVKPGYTYEYQVQIRVANPNFGKKSEVAYPSLAERKELESPWSEAACSLTVPRETYVYGVELDDKAIRIKQQSDTKLLTDKSDITFMQVHHWLETTNLNPDQRGSNVPVGDWTVGDLAVRRGEFIRRLEHVKVPVWFPTKKAFDIAVPIQGQPKAGVIGAKPPPVRGIPVLFDAQDLLVDFEGGKFSQSFKVGDKGQKTVVENANVEYLVMTTDGKLHLRSSRADDKDSDRSQRYEAWDKRVKEVEAGGGRPVAGPGDKGGIKDPFKK